MQNLVAKLKMITTKLREAKKLKQKRRTFSKESRGKNAPSGLRSTVTWLHPPHVHMRRLLPKLIDNLEK
jgi:hypothetical protein